MATRNSNSHVGKLGLFIDICFCKHTKPALYEECRLHLQTITVSNFITNAVVQIKQITTRSISQTCLTK